MASDPPKVLISFSHDSPEHEQRVLELANRLRRGGIDCTIDLYVVVPEEGWPLWMERQIRDSNFVLLVCTETYLKRVLGEEQPGNGLGVRWEGNLIYNAIYNAGVMNTKFIPLLFVAGEAAHVPTPLQGTTFYEPFTDAGYEKLYCRLSNQHQAVKPELGKLPPGERKSEGVLGRLVNVPELPTRFLERPNDLEAIKRALLAGLNQAVGVTQSLPHFEGQAAEKVGLQGMAGIGKSVLAAALARDKEVRQMFSDGIYWLAIGQTPNVLNLQGQLARQLTGAATGFTTEQEGKDALRKALEGQLALVVLDDVWNVDHGDAFSVTAPPARLLITTRNNEVLVGLGAEERRVDVLSSSDALKMLAEWVGQKSPDKLPLEAAEVAKECGYLPLALAMIGAMVRSDPRSTAWPDALSRLKRADLEKIKRSFPGYQYPDLLRAIDVSIEGLEPTDRERYLDMAVFPEDVPIPEAPLRILWNTDEIDTRDCMARLVACSLATWTTAESALILHDLQRDLILKRREKKLPGLHLRLVEAWDALPKLPDSYAWREVAYHLLKAGCKEDLRRLLLNFNYLQAKICVNDVNALIADYDYLPEDKDLQLLQSAIRLSANILVRESRQLAGQLTGRLLGNIGSNIRGLLKQVAGAKAWTWLRPLNAGLTAPGGSLIRTFEGHTYWVNAVGVTIEVGLAVSASPGGTLRIWDLSSGQTLRKLEGHSSSIRAIGVTADGRRAISASNDCTLRVWDLESCQSLRSLEGHTDWVTAVMMTPDGRRAVSASSDRTLRVWDLESGQSLRTLRGHTDSVTAVAVTADGRCAVSGSSDRTLRLWDVESGQSLRTLLGHTNEVTAVAVTPEGNRAISASSDQTLRLWNLESGQSLRAFEGHTSQVNAVAVTPDGKRAISASSDQTLRLWDLSSGQNLRAFEGHTGPVSAVVITSDGLRALSGSRDATLRLWDLERDQSLNRQEGHTSRVNSVAITPDGRRAVSASSDKTLRVWDVESGQSLRVLEGHSDRVTGVAITPDGRRAISASFDKTLRVWDLESGHSPHTLEGQSDRIIWITITPDGHSAVSASEGSKLRLWDLKSGRGLTLQGHTRPVNAVAVTVDGRRAVSASDDRTLRVWDLESGQSLHTLGGHRREVIAVGITPDDRHALSVSNDWTLRMWDLESARTVRTLEDCPWRKGYVALTIDGGRTVSALYHRTLRLWELEKGIEIAAFTGDSLFRSCASTPDGRTLIVGDDSGQVRFLQLVEADETKPAIGDTKIPLLSNSSKTHTPQSG